MYAASRIITRIIIIIAVVFLAMLLPRLYLFKVLQLLCTLWWKDFILYILSSSEDSVFMLNQPGGVTSWIRRVKHSLHYPKVRNNFNQIQITTLIYSRWSERYHQTKQSSRKIIVWIAIFWCSRISAFRLEVCFFFSPCYDATVSFLLSLGGWLISFKNSSSVL